MLPDRIFIYKESVSMKRIVCRAILSVGICLFLALTANAGYSLSPMITILEPMDGKASAEIELKFIGDVKVPVAVELTLKVREIDINGNVVNVDDKSVNNISVFPTQIVLMPDDVQLVQVQWVGETVPKKEIAFSLISVEAPVKTEEPKEKPTKAVGMVTLLTKYVAIVVVRPRGINLILLSNQLKQTRTLPAETVWPLS
jgi:P pilus assembly chaperone PapD